MYFCLLCLVFEERDAKAELSTRSEELDRGGHAYVRQDCDDEDKS